MIDNLLNKKQSAYEQPLENVVNGKPATITGIANNLGDSLRKTSADWNTTRCHNRLSESFT